ncbi:MAG: hypothetical protein GTO46_05815 [Gemmatimonadetes bacterium]|nr:hypothetical protein [Gemmatimonadota bacterium]NIO31125.1 hypothetical protein [Gemmatimonadota bacterium]
MKHLPLLSLCVVSACADGRGASSASVQERGPHRSVEADSSFARLIERLSEPGGYFDTDNLISNERSYLHVVGALEELGVRGGAYIGVGPDQNFSYIAAVLPEIAFIVDIRRDNLLQHLMFKALFALTRNRFEYLCLLHGRPVPDDIESWAGRGIDEIVDYIDTTAAGPDLAETVLSRVVDRARAFGYPLSESDLETIRRFHTMFIWEGLSLRFQSHGRRPRPYYPTYRQLLLERDLGGRQASYLADEGAFQFVKSLQQRDLIIPVVGDFAGRHALRAVGEYLRERGTRVSAFYTSNVEQYLMRGGTFDRYTRNLAQLPRSENSVIIRSFFGGNFGYLHPQAVPGYYSVQLLQRIEDMLSYQTSGGRLSYLDLVTRDAVDLRAASGQ